MIIRDELAPDRGIADVQIDGDLIKVQHVQDIDPILSDLALRRKEQNDGGWSGDRTMKFMGTVPSSIFVIHPEFIHDTKALVKWLEHDAVGQQFLVNRTDTGKSGQVIVK